VRACLGDEAEAALLSSSAFRWAFYSDPRALAAALDERGTRERALKRALLELTPPEDE